jgi:hypothetical protein
MRFVAVRAKDSCGGLCTACQLSELYGGKGSCRLIPDSDDLCSKICVSGRHARSRVAAVRATSNAECPPPLTVSISTLLNGVESGPSNTQKLIAGVLANERTASCETLTSYLAAIMTCTALTATCRTDGGPAFLRGFSSQKHVKYVASSILARLLSNLVKLGAKVSATK